ncbi:MAG TPA: ABC transporter permease [Anaerolineales bacterium]|nr:ABC transporter permease [Anaerolineales bacterium]
MKVVSAVWRKEMLDFLRDRRKLIWALVYSLVLMPALFIVPTALLMFRTSQQMTQALKVPVQGMENAPKLVEYLKGEEIEAVPAIDVEMLIREKQFTVGLIVPSDFEERVSAGESLELTVFSDDSKSLDVTASRLTGVLGDYRNELVIERLEQNDLPAELLEPFTVERKNAATATETAGSTLSLIIPGFLLTLGLTAGMQVAVNSTAGEKERLTLEPVLFTPVDRRKLVLGKLLAVLTSIMVFMLNMVLSLGLSFLGLALVAARIAMAASDAANNGLATSVPQADVYMITPLNVSVAILSIVPIMVLGASIQLAIATWARSNDEAYGYLNPLSFLSSLPLIVVLFIQDFIPSLWYYAIPIFGTILAMRDLLIGKWMPSSVLVMFISSLLYALLALGWAVWMFGREEVVFRT